MSSEDRIAEVERRLDLLEDLVRKLTEVVQADLESLKLTDAELARQGRQISPGRRWPAP